MMSATILIIEEHNLLREALQTWLKVMFSDCYVIEATNITEAVNLSHTFPPQVVLVDLETSNGAGPEIVNHIKKAIPGALVAILTSYGAGTFPSRAVAGASAHISKTAICSQLKAVLTELLSTIKSEPETELSRKVPLPFASKDIHSVGTARSEASSDAETILDFGKLSENS